MIQKCDKCGKRIGFNEAYISITYNLQTEQYDIAQQENYIDIQHSEVVMIFCGNCGNQHNAHKMKEAIDLQKVTYQRLPPQGTEHFEYGTKAHADFLKKEMALQPEFEFLRYPRWLQSRLRKMTKEQNCTYREIYDDLEDLIKAFT